MSKILLLVLSFLTVLSCQQKKSVTPNTEDEKAFYSLGAMLGSRFKELDLTDQELALVKQGLEDSARDKQQFDPSKHQFKIQEIFNDRMKKKSDEVKGKGTAFLEAFKKEEGVMTTESGLAYKILTAGSGVKPKETDEVEVHYHGTLIDGTVFDSSVERGKTVNFPLNRVIKGWIEGLQLIGEGGKVKLVIPSELGYGDHGAPPKIPGGSVLVFEVELFKVNKDGGVEKKPAKK
jgi:FKBP-type peptidyl-prolyl cis-trans isomerase FkpA